MKDLWETAGGAEEEKRRSCRIYFLHISFYLVSATAEIVLDVSIFPSQSKKHGLLETKTDWSVFSPQYMLDQILGSKTDYTHGTLHFP